jgi:hypothetical protein
MCMRTASSDANVLLQQMHVLPMPTFWPRNCRKAPMSTMYSMSGMKKLNSFAMYSMFASTVSNFLCEKRQSVGVSTTPV